MRTGWCSAVAGVVLVVAACGESREPRVQFSFTEAAEPVPVTIIKSDTTTTALGYRVAQLHVFLPTMATEAVARATLQHLIDSIAVADTLSAGIHVVGFVIDDFDPVTGEATLVPSMSALWAPTDSIGITGSVRTARFMTTFTVHPSFSDDDSAQGER